MNNFAIIINKEKNVTSRDVVNRLSKILKIKKIGHTGTLDPLATGVLVCLTGKYTKLVEIITALEKEYIATIKLGVKTDTGDITGNILEQENHKILDKDKIIEALNSFIGEYEEEIPLYSAVHVNGKRLYEYARSGENIVLPRKKVTIKEIEFLDYKDDCIKFRVVASKGTYIRSLIESICEKLNVLGTMSELIRTKQGKFKIEDSYILERIENNNYKYLKIEDILPVKILDMNDNNSKKILNGNVLEMNESGYVLFKDKEEEIALYYFENGVGILKILIKDN